MSKVSVIIPLYNQRQFVAGAIQSVLAQDYLDIEIIIVNDGSTDKPLEVLKKYEKDIIVISQENKGLAAARNTGFKNCSGEYIQFLDADDILLPPKISRQINFFEKNKDYSICFCNYIILEEASNPPEATQLSFRFFRKEEIIQMAASTLNDFIIPIHAILMRRGVINNIGGFCETLKALEEREFYIRVALNNYKFAFLPYIGVYYRQHSKGMTKNLNHMRVELEKFNKRLGVIFKTRLSNDDKLRKVLSKNYFHLLTLIRNTSYTYGEQINVIDKILQYNKDFCADDWNIFKHFIVKILGLHSYYRLSWPFKLFLRKLFYENRY